MFVRSRKRGIPERAEFGLTIVAARYRMQCDMINNLHRNTDREAVSLVKKTNKTVNFLNENKTKKTETE